MSIRVDNPVVLVVNKKKLGANRLAPSTLLVTTKSEWSPGVVVGGNTPDIRQAHWFAVFLRLLDKLIDWCDTKMGKTFIYGRKDLAPLGSLKLSAPSAQVAMSLIPRCITSKPCIWFVPFHGALSSFKYPYNRALMERGCGGDVYSGNPRFVSQMITISGLSCGRIRALYLLPIPSWKFKVSWL